MVEESRSAQSAPTPAPPAGETPAPTENVPVGENVPAGQETHEVPVDPGFLERGGLRRRLRFLRKTRELAYRDLGGLVFEMHRLGREREDLLKGKLATLARIDTELRAIEAALREHRGVTVLREAGVTACPRCAAIHGSEDRFCPACGFSIAHGERPIAATPVATPASAQTNMATPASAQANTPAPVSAQVSTVPASAATSTPVPPPAPIGTPAPGPPAPARTPTPPAATDQPHPSPSLSPPEGERDEPTEIIEPPTRIVHPGKSNRA